MVPGRLIWDMHEESDPLDLQVARIAARQYGAVSIAQLRDIGLSADAVLGRRRAGRLHRLHRGVYAVGHMAPCIERLWLAAVLAHGSGAVVSHRSAAALWGLLPNASAVVEISIPKRSGRQARQGIRLHRCTSLQPQHVTRRRGIPTTTVARTIADLRPAVSPELWRRAVRQAHVLGLPTGPGISEDGTRSELEHRFLKLCARHGLPKPEVNVRVGSWMVDFLWPAHRLVAETDGYSFHRGPIAFEDDHARDLGLRALDYSLLRFSYRQVIDEPHKVVDALQNELRASGGSS